ncbi:MAG: hypothetical protein ACFBSF_20515 [Leptolyngbyaceae cyanobacterium]
MKRRLVLVAPGLIVAIVVGFKTNTFAQDQLCYHTNTEGSTLDLSDICGVQEVERIFPTKEELRARYKEPGFNLVIDEIVSHGENSHSQNLYQIPEPTQEEAQEFCDAFSSVDSHGATEETEDFYAVLEDSCERANQ